MKRFLVLSVTLLLLSACGGKSRSVKCDQNYWDGTVGTCLPKGWYVIDAETLRQRGIADDTVAAFQAEEPISGQFPTVTITKEQLGRTVNPGDYSFASVRSIEVLTGYEELDTEEIKIDGEKVKLHTFSAKPQLNEPKRRFYQVSTVHEKVGYTVTATAPLSIERNDEQKLRLMLTEFSFEEPEEEE